jgi:hypothetical protein
MTEINRSTASELDGLSDPARQETEEILNEIEQEENKELDKKPPEDGKPKPEDKKEETPDKKPEDGKPEDERTPKKPDTEPERKSSSLMPSYVHKIAMEKKEAEISDLKKKVDELSKGVIPKSEERPVTAEQEADLEKEVTRLAEEHKLDPKLVKGLLDLGMKYGGKLPPEVTAKLAQVDKITQESEVLAEETAYNAAFDKHVLPLIKAEYGDLPEDTIQAIREKMKEKAYSADYAKTPYSVIYKGVDDFRSYKRPPAKSAESGEGGDETGGEGDGASEFENVTDADIDRMDSATFDRYTAHMEKKERGR